MQSITKRIVISFALCALLSSLASASENAVIRLSEPVEVTESSETFGAKLDTSAPIVNIDDIAKEPSKYLGEAITVQTPITKVCQKKGCFFIVQTEQEIFRVSFKDYSFFIPTDSGGKTVWLSGEVIEKTLSEEQAEHFSSDINQGDEKAENMIHSGKSYEIVATSVQIPIA